MATTERSGGWRHISARVAVRAYGWIAEAAGWQWRVEVAFAEHRDPELLTPRQARLMARRLIALADQCERANAAPSPQPQDD